MRQRAISAVVLVPVLLIVLAIGGPVLAAGVALLTVLAGIEVFRLLKSAGYAPFAALGCVLALAIVLEAAFPEELEGSGILLAAIGIVLIAVAGFTKVEPRDGLQAWMTTVFGAFYVSLLSFIIRLGNAAPDVPANAPLTALGAERGWILLLILAVWSFDTGAYLTGRSIGRTHFITHISPAKTVEGVVGGVVASTIVVALMLWGLGSNPLHALALGPLVALAAQAGDLAESVIKRAAGAKDSGTLIPGHGGILDRVDSFVFAAPVLTLYVVAVLR
jgi:phosphatidate cytidylyltransferase